jgi:predicted transcriptional regulator
VKLKKVIEIIEGTVLTQQPDLDEDIKFGGATDLMSDALAYMIPGSVLLTGLKNVQAVRTAEMAYVAAIIFVRGKLPDPEAVRLAEQLGIPLITTNFSMFESCGRLFQSGMPSVPLTPL